MEFLHIDAIEAKSIYAEIATISKGIFLAIGILRIYSTRTPILEVAVSVVRRRIDCLNLCSRPCGCNSCFSRSCEVRIGSYSHSLAVGGLVGSCIKCRNGEVVRRRGSKTRNGDFAVSRSQFEINGFGSIYYVELDNLVVVGCSNSNHYAAPSLADELSGSHDRFLRVVRINIFFAEHLELEDLHTPLGSSLGAPEADVTNFLVVVQHFRCQLVGVAINTRIANIIISEHPVAVVQ